MGEIIIEKKIVNISRRSIHLLGDPGLFLYQLKRDLSHVKTSSSLPVIHTCSNRLIV